MSAKGWTDTEKAGIYFQIIEKLGGKIPWNDLTLPEGRTLKAVQVMFDKEKNKLRKAADGEDAPPTPAVGKKRSTKTGAADEDGDKNKNPRKKLRMLRDTTGDSEEVADPLAGDEVKRESDDDLT